MIISNHTFGGLQCAQVSKSRVWKGHDAQMNRSWQMWVILHIWTCHQFTNTTRFTYKCVVSQMHHIWMRHVTNVLHRNASCLKHFTYECIMSQSFFTWMRHGTHTTNCRQEGTWLVVMVSTLRSPPPLLHTLTYSPTHSHWHNCRHNRRHTRISDTLTHTHQHTCTDILATIHADTLALPTHSHILVDTRPHTRAYSLTHADTLSHILADTLALSYSPPTNSPKLTRTHALSLAHTHTHDHTHTHIQLRVSVCEREFIWVRVREFLCEKRVCDSCMFA